MKISVNNKTGLMIEAQSNGKDETLISNANQYGFDDVSVMEINENELNSYIQAAIILTLDERKAEKQSEIDALEASQYMTRGEREGWLAMIEAQAAAQSVPLDVLYVANPFYKKLKDVNTAVTALRAELKAIV